MVDPAAASIHFLDCCRRHYIRFNCLGGRLDLNQSIAISARDLSVSLANKCILKNVSFDVRFGELTALIGRNGVGKTTLLKKLVQLSSKDQGISYLPQAQVLNLDFPIQVLDFVRMANKATIDDAKQILRRLDLQDCAGQYLDTLSGGQFQKALFARLLAERPRVIVLDEPFRSVDSPTTHFLLRILREEVAQKNVAAFVVIHDLQIAYAHFDQTFLLNDGRLTMGPTKDVFASDTFQNAFAQPAFVPCPL